MALKKRIPFHALILAMFVLTGIVQPAAAESLQLLRALEIGGESGIEPSGLAYCNGRLLFVSDKRDDAIYEITLEPTRAIAKPAIMLNQIPRAELPSAFALWKKLAYRLFLLIGRPVYDWEGIFCAPDGSLLLGSESVAGVLEVSPDGRSQWLETDAYESARREQMMQKDNAYIEGIASDGKTLFIAIEREPRGIMSLTKRSEGEFAVDRIVKHTTPSDLLPAVPGRPDDVADLAFSNGALYVLERNRSGVCRLDMKSLDAVACWSYANFENDPEYSYQDTAYGLGEGLVIYNGRMIIVFDNNGLPRKKNSNNASPLLLEFAFVH